MIARDAQPIDHRSPYKRIDLAARRRKAVITMDDYENGEIPDEAIYWFDHCDKVWRLIS